MTTLAAVRRDRRGVRNLRKALGRCQAEASRIRSVLTGAQRKALARQEELHQEAADSLSDQLQVSQARVAELESARGAFRAFWRAVLGRKG